MSALEEYGARLARFEAQDKHLDQQFRRVGNARLLIAIAAAVLAWIIFARHSLGVWWLLIPLVAFVALAIWHQRILRTQTLAKRASGFYKRALARLQDDWIGRGNPGDRFRTTDHVYADDLDVFGKGGLFELVATARTRAGEDTLAGWLLTPASLVEAKARQSAIEELAPRVDLREDIALLAEDVPSEIRVEPMASWGAASIVRFPGWLRPVASVLGVLGIAAVIGFFTRAIPLWPLAAILVCDFALIYAFRERTKKVLESVEGSGRDLGIFSALVARLEQESFATASLEALQKAFLTQGGAASTRIAHLGRLLDWLDSGDHALVRIFRPLVFWNEQLAISFENWRQDAGASVAGWLKAAAEFEALSAFAALRFERPSWTMPELLDTQWAQFRAEGLKHPLLPERNCVANDVTVSLECPMLVVSGSNMSGKSTLLRAVGLNAVLAWAGAPIPAAKLTISPLQVGASIRVNDSLQDHRSRFFAEISRLRQIVDLTRAGTPVLFLLDELLSGTNSHDRRIGAAGIVKGLLAAHAIGLVSTHDLALAGIAHDVNAGIRNVHFEDEMHGAEMRFDYKLKPGIVEHSNALALMRAIGLEV